MIVPRELLQSYPYDVAKCFGMPNFGAEYVGSQGRYRRTGEYCAVCGRQATNCHHVVRRGRTFRLRRADGMVVALRSPLMLLCGSGVTGCHGKAHSGDLRIEWVWKSEEDERRWWDGELLMDYAPYDQRLYRFGFWLIDDTESHLIKEIRGTDVSF